MRSWSFTARRSARDPAEPGRGRFWLIALVGVLASIEGGVLARQTPGSAADAFNDSHFHLTNYIQQGIEVRDFLRIMGTRVERSTLFGIPLQQQWSYGNSGDFAPTYYLHSDAPLYYYSFTDAYIATVYRACSVLPLIGILTVLLPNLDGHAHRT